MFKKAFSVLLVTLFGCFLTSCAGKAYGTPEPQTTPAQTETKADTVRWPKEKLTLTSGGIPELKVYVVDDSVSRAMDIETYVEGVLAGEMKNDWPTEALKAQAILARTFVLKFIQEKESKYPDADISTDIEEAQAYSASDINDSIKQAVQNTQGMVLSYRGELPYAWFHAHSGGATDIASVGLGWDEKEPGYTICTQGNEPESVSADGDAQALREAQTWAAEFPLETLESALADLGVEASLSENTAVSIDQRGDSGRAAVLLIDGREVDAADLRIRLGSTKMRSTLLSTLNIRAGMLRMSGKGYGHGVGMSQWGAYGMARTGRTAEEIIQHYFQDVTIEKLW